MTMTSKNGFWQFRVMAHKDGDNEICFKVHTVYFNSNGDAEKYSENGTMIVGETIDELKNIVDSIYLSIHAIGSKIPKNRIIWAGEKFPSYYDYKPIT